MRRVTVFSLLTAASLLSLFIVIILGYYVLVTPSSPQTGGWENMWGGMMGGMMGSSQFQAQSSAGQYLGAAFVVLLVVAIIGVGGLIYFVVFPELRLVSHISPIHQPLLVNSGAVSETYSVPVGVTAFDSVVKTLTVDERKVVDVLVSRGGKYLQKYIRSEAGLSRLKTHRIVSRLTQRGIVSLEKTGNTNTVMLADWLLNE